MKTKQENLFPDRLKDLTDIEFAFARIETLSDLLTDFVHNSNDLNKPEPGDKLIFTLMTISDLAKCYGNQLQNSHIIDNEIKPLKAAE
jgi:hypothetical protein